MQGILLEIGYFERRLSKSLKRFTSLSTACHLHVTRMHLYVMRMSLVCTRMSLVCHSCVIRMSLVCILMSSVCRSYVLVYHSYVTRMWFYHGPQIIRQLTMVV